MSVKGFNTENGNERYDYNSLDNLPDIKGLADNQISEHNVSTESHRDIRDLINNLSNIIGETLIVFTPDNFQVDTACYGTVGGSINTLNTVGTNYGILNVSEGETYKIPADVYTMYYTDSNDYILKVAEDFLTDFYIIPTGCAKIHFITEEDEITIKKIINIKNVDYLIMSDELKSKLGLVTIGDESLKSMIDGNINNFDVLFPKINKNLFDFEKIQTVSQITNNGDGSFTTNPVADFGSVFIDTYASGTKGIQPLSAGKYYISFKFRLVSGNKHPSYGAVTKLSLYYTDSEGNLTKGETTEIFDFVPTSEYQTYQASYDLLSDAVSYGLIIQFRSGGDMVIDIKDIMISSSDSLTYYPFGLRAVNSEKLELALTIKNDNISDGSLLPQKMSFLKKSDVNLFDISKIKTLVNVTNNSGIFTTSALDNFYSFFIDCQYDASSSLTIPKGVQSLKAGKLYLSFKYKYVSGIVGNRFIGNVYLNYIDGNGDNQNILMTKLVNKTPLSVNQLFMASVELPEDISSYGFSFQVVSGGDLVVDITDIMVSYTDSKIYVPYEAYTNDNKTFVVTLSEDLMSLITPKYINLRVLYLGDSITASQGWVQVVNNDLQVSFFVNVAVHGASWKDHTNTILDGNPVLNGEDNNVNNTISNQVEKVLRGKDSTHESYEYVADYEDFDLILIAAGTNDIGNIKQSDIDSMEDNFILDGEVVSVENLDRTTMGGAMRYTYEKLRGVYPEAIIAYCTPIQGNETLRPYKKIVMIGNSIKAFCDRISDVKLIDTFKCGICGIYENNNSSGKYLVDGLHTNVEGGKIQGEYVAREVKSFFI